VTHPYPPPHGRAPARPVRKNLAWLWIVIAVATLTLIGAGVLLTGKRGDEHGSAAAPAPSTAPTTGKQDRVGRDACRRLRDLGATTFDGTINRSVGELAGTSTDQEIVARGKNLVDAAEKAAGQDPIDANLAISKAQLELGEACRRAFGDTGS
jgi:hypothetical protein